VPKGAFHTTPDCLAVRLRVTKAVTRITSATRRCSEQLGRIGNAEGTGGDNWGRRHFGTGLQPVARHGISADCPLRNQCRSRVAARLWHGKADRRRFLAGFPTAANKTGRAPGRPRIGSETGIMPAHIHPRFAGSSEPSVAILAIVPCKWHADCYRRGSVLLPWLRGCSRPATWELREVFGNDSV